MQLDFLKSITPFSDDDYDPGAVPRSSGVDPDYVERQISRIISHGDDARWRLASHLNMFESLNPNGFLTPEQREAVDNFAHGWIAPDGEECEGCEIDFPESQYVAVGLDLESAIELGDSWRRGEWLPDVGHPAADRVSERLNEMTNQPNALRK